METAKQIIEAIQEESYRRMGVNPANVRSSSLDHVVELIGRRQEADADPNVDAYCEKLRQIAARQHLARFQDPVTISEILECWQLIQEGNPDEALDIKDSQDHPANVLLATAPTGNLNACAIQGDDGSKGILFEVDLQAWAKLIARLIVELLVTETDESFQIRHPSDPEAFNGKETVLQRLFDVLVGTAIDGSVLSVLDRFVSPGASEERGLVDLVNKGCLIFVSGHELAHVIRRHHNMAERGEYWIPKQASETWRKYESIYQGLYPGLTLEAAARKLMKQALEYEADYYGYQYAANTFALHPALQALIQNQEGTKAAPPNINVMFVEIGIRSFLWSMEYLERTIRTLTSGHDGATLGIFSEDFDVQDIVCRDTHPCPRTRLEMANKAFTMAPPVNALLKTLFERFWHLAYPSIQALYKSGARPHPKWISDATEIAPQLTLL